MATIYFAERVNVPPAEAWKVIEDYTTAKNHLFSAASAQRMERVEEGTEERPAGEYRVVTTADGEHEHWELIIGTVPEHMYASYTVPGLFGSTHHSAAMQIRPIDENTSEVIWVTDVLPDSFAAEVEQFYKANFDDIVAVVQGQDVRPESVRQ
jgi:hypothetical protein